MALTHRTLYTPAQSDAAGNGSTNAARASGLGSFGSVVAVVGVAAGVCAPLPFARSGLGAAAAPPTCARSLGRRPGIAAIRTFRMPVDRAGSHKGINHRPALGFREVYASCAFQEMSRAFLAVLDGIPSDTLQITGTLGPGSSL